MIIYYCILFSTLLLLLSFIFYILYFKWYHPFWYTQPVFHYHNIYNWIFPCGVIYKNNLPFSPKYTNDFNIKIFDINDCNKIFKDKYYELVKNNYLSSGDMIYNPEQMDIYSYFIGHSNKSYLTLYISIINGKSKIISGLTSRPLNVNIRKKKFITNYVDYLCTDKNHRNKNTLKKSRITPQTIYTFGTNTINSRINTFLFKREGENMAIVPFVKYFCYMYNVENFVSKPLDQLYKITLITKDNINLFLHNFSNLIHNVFENTIIADLSNIKELIQNNILKCFVLNKNHDVIALYFFRNNKTKYNNDIVYESIGNIMTSNNGISIYKNISQREREKLFVNNFYNCIEYLKKHDNIKYLLLENISHTNIIYNQIYSEYKYLYKMIYSYYFYNYIELPKESKNTFILN